jgi:16S rRNA (guanine527-N7)-methyltransferase
MNEINNKMRNLLATGLETLGLTLMATQQEQLWAYSLQVVRFGKSLRLVKANDEQLMIRHTFDSLAAVKKIELLAPTTVIDVGSGAGFPGICLAIALPQVQFHLVERMHKRAAFLQGIKALLRLDNVTIWSCDLCEIELVGDLVVFRALTAMSADLVKQCLRKAPRIAAYKGRAQECELERHKLLSAGFKSFYEELSVPFLEEERNILFIEKA